MLKAGVMLMSIDWFCWDKFQENPTIFMGKSGWFPIKIFPSTSPLMVVGLPNVGKSTIINGLKQINEMSVPYFVVPLLH